MDESEIHGHVSGLALRRSWELSQSENEWYIRSMVDIPSHEHVDHPEDEQPLANESQSLRIIVCMTKKSSERLLHAQYLQCDIGFKRVLGYQEFELAGMDHASNISVTYCRVFVTRQTAVAHQRVFEEIAKIVYQDTGKALKWRHLHARTLNDYDGMILLLTLDQHGGQAKGIGLYLQKLCQEESLRNKQDLHEPHRILSELSPYEHLHRLIRLCTVHFMRNIRKCAVCEETRHLMRSLSCITHPGWEAAIKDIAKTGGKAGRDWLHDKERSGFTFQAICWEKSNIPLDIWRAGSATSNTVESVHSDVNREGIRCTLVGGVCKGQLFDLTKLRALEARESAGIRTSYNSGHISENITKGIKQKCKLYIAGHHHKIEAEDAKIEVHNKKLKAAQESLRKRTTAYEAKKQSFFAGLCTAEATEKAKKSVEKAQGDYEKLIASSANLPMGSGRIAVVTPVSSGFDTIM
ncbi:hypothetical protein C0993_000824 [Termitomyces sp. T159_Od127]|nr:hypothetical protein C0993_000824 [Termitomyces sp. T159_Od127]